MALTLTTTAEQLRRMVRVSTNKLDQDLEGFKKAFLTRLEMTGVDTIPVGDELAISCLQLYLRWMINYNGEAERYHQNFLELEDSMRKSSRYHTFEESEEENEES